MGEAAYLIHLKNGGEFATFRYWKEGDQIRFYVPGGIVGISRDSIRKIEKTVPETTGYVKSDSDREAVKIPPPETDKNLTDKPEEDKIDVTYYKEQKSQLEVQLKRALEKVREADKNNDSIAKERARADAKEISDKMYDLTAELIKKNKGKMPESWWKKE